VRAPHAPAVPARCKSLFFGGPFHYNLSAPVCARLFDHFQNEAPLFSIAPRPICVVLDPIWQDGQGETGVEFDRIGSNWSKHVPDLQEFDGFGHDLAVRKPEFRSLKCILCAAGWRHTISCGLSQSGIAVPAAARLCPSEAIRTPRGRTRGGYVPRRIRASTSSSSSGAARVRFSMPPSVTATVSSTRM